MEMVWLWSPHTIPYGMSVWNGMALESTYHTLWYDCMEWLPYHMVLFWKADTIPCGMILEGTIPCNMIVWRYDFDLVQWHCQSVVPHEDHSGIHLPYSTLAQNGIHMSNLQIMLVACRWDSVWQHPPAAFHHWFHQHPFILYHMFPTQPYPTSNT